MRVLSLAQLLSPEPRYLGNPGDDECATLGGCLLGCPPAGLSQLANGCLCYRVQAVGKVALPCWRMDTGHG